MNDTKKVVNRGRFVPAELPNNQDIIRGLLTFEDKKPEVKKPSGKSNADEKEPNQDGSSDSSATKTVSTIS